MHFTICYQTYFEISAPIACFHETIRNLLINSSVLSYFFMELLKLTQWCKPEYYFRFLSTKLTFFNPSLLSPTL